MFWDVALAIVGALATGLNGILGWRVTVDGGVPPARRKLYEFSFAAATLVGIVCVGLTAYRSAITNQHMTAQIHARFHADKVEWARFHNSADAGNPNGRWLIPDRPIGATVWLTNRGALPAKVTRGVCLLKVGPRLASDLENDLFGELTAGKSKAPLLSTEILQGDNVQLACRTAAAISEHEYYDLLDKREVVYIGLSLDYGDSALDANDDALNTQVCGYFVVSDPDQIIYCQKDHNH